MNSLLLILMCSGLVVAVHSVCVFQQFETFYDLNNFTPGCDGFNTTGFAQVTRLPDALVLNANNNTHALHIPDGKQACFTYNERVYLYTWSTINTYVHLKNIKFWPRHLVIYLIGDTGYTYTYAMTDSLYTKPGPAKWRYLGAGLTPPYGGFYKIAFLITNDDSELYIDYLKIYDNKDDCPPGS